MNVNNITRMRLGGINSGTDVESMVRAMGMAARSRINNNQRRVLQLQAQQNAYRDVISRLQAFQRSYFDFLNPATNLRSLATFNQRSATIFDSTGAQATPPGVSVSVGVSAAPGTHNVTLVRNATQAQKTGNRIEPQGGLEIDFSTLTSGTPDSIYGLRVRVGTTERTIVVDMRDGGDAREIINNELQRLFGTNNAGNGIVSINSSGQISSTDGRAVAISDFGAMTSSLELDFDTANISTGTNTFNIQVNGQMQTITFQSISEDQFAMLFNSSGNRNNMDERAAAVQARADELLEPSRATWLANFSAATAEEQATMRTTLVNQAFQAFRAATPNTPNTAAARDAWLAGLSDDSNSELFRIANASRYINMASEEYLAALNAFNSYTTSQFRTQFFNEWRDGMDLGRDATTGVFNDSQREALFQATRTDSRWNSFFNAERTAAWRAETGRTTGTPPASWNWSDFGGYETLEDFRSARSAADLATWESDNPLTATQERNLRNNFVSNEMHWFGVHAGTVGIQVNGSSVPTLADFRNSFTPAQIASSINENTMRTAIEQLTWADGVRLEVDFTGGSANITATQPDPDNPNGPRIPATDVNMAFSLNQGSVNRFGAAYGDYFNFTQKTFAGNATLASVGVEDGDYITINGRRFELRGDMMLSELANTVNNSNAGVTMAFNALTNSFSFTANQAGANGRIELGGNALDNLGLFDHRDPANSGLIIDRDDPAFTNHTIPGFRVGTNLELNVNGNLVETEGNSFTLDDGVTFTFEPHVPAGTTFRVEIGTDQSSAVAAVRSFVESYNALVRDISIGMLMERPSSGHHFLTDLDIESLGMTETQVGQWQAMANQGLLFNNRTVANVMGNMRNAMMMTMGGFGLHSIVGNDGTPAIRQSMDFREMGQLEFNEQAFAEALERNPERIAEFFAGEGGLMSRLHDELHRALNTMGPESTHGTLVRRAGMPTGTTASNNALFERIRSLNSTINVLEARYQRNEERLWRRFTNMERQFASLNAQSDQINGFFMGLF